MFNVLISNETLVERILVVGSRARGIEWESGASVAVWCWWGSLWWWEHCTHCRQTAWQIRVFLQKQRRAAASHTQPSHSTQHGQNCTSNILPRSIVLQTTFLPKLLARHAKLSLIWPIYLFWLYLRRSSREAMARNNYWDFSEIFWDLAGRLCVVVDVCANTPCCQIKSIQITSSTLPTSAHQFLSLGVWSLCGDIGELYGGRLSQKPKCGVVSDGKIGTLCVGPFSQVVHNKAW